MSERRTHSALGLVAVSAIVSLVLVVLTWAEEAAAPVAEHQHSSPTRVNADSLSATLLAPPTANETWQPAEAYAGSTLRGGAIFTDPDGDPVPGLLRVHP